MDVQRENQKYQPRSPCPLFTEEQSDPDKDRNPANEQVEEDNGQSYLKYEEAVPPRGECDKQGHPLA
jgi:hypothetical protein